MSNFRTFPAMPIDYHGSNDLFINSNFEANDVNWLYVYNNNHNLNQLIGIYENTYGFSEWQNGDEIHIMPATNQPDGDNLVFVCKTGDEDKLARLYTKPEFVTLQFSNRLWLEKQGIVG